MCCIIYCCVLDLHVKQEEEQWPFSYEVFLQVWMSRKHQIDISFTKTSSKISPFVTFSKSADIRIKLSTYIFQTTVSLVIRKNNSVKGYCLWFYRLINTISHSARNHGYNYKGMECKLRSGDTIAAKRLMEYVLLVMNWEWSICHMIKQWALACSV